LVGWLACFAGWFVGRLVVGLPADCFMVVGLVDLFDWSVGRWLEVWLII
jgi:hypothetical protein